MHVIPPAFTAQLTHLQHLSLLSALSLSLMPSFIGLAYPYAPKSTAEPKPDGLPTAQAGHLQ